jgi:histidyl-tRNA synthetase
MKSANKLGARVTMVVGPDELAGGRWTVKDMTSGEQEAIGDSDLEARLAALLGSPEDEG